MAIVIRVTSPGGAENMEVVDVELAAPRGG